MIYWDVLLNDWHEVVADATIPMMRTVCNFKGQAVGGCVLSDWYDCDESFYVWSKVGEMDFTPSARNEAGYRRDPHGGEVYHVRQLGDLVIGYSSKGVTGIVPVDSPAPTFGFKWMSEVGVLNRGAVGGNLNRHVYVGEDYILREVTEKGVKELGYQHYMEELEGNEDIIVNYEPSNKDFYIGNSTKTYLLSPQGLSEVPQHPSTVWRLNRESYMLPDTVDTYEPLIVTEVFDMGYRGQKTIFSMESDVLLTLSPQVAVDWANSLDSWGYTPFSPLNNEGLSFIIASGGEFRFRLKYTQLGDNVAVRISYIKVRYKMTDLRGIRGVYAPPPRGQ